MNQRDQMLPYSVQDLESLAVRALTEGTEPPEGFIPDAAYRGDGVYGYRLYQGYIYVFGLEASRTPTLITIYKDIYDKE